MPKTKRVLGPDCARKKAKAATRQKIVEAARLLFEAGGYEAATIRTIASVAGMSTGAVFASFTGKEALYREIYGHGPITPEVGQKLLTALATCRGRFEEYALLHHRKGTPEGAEKAVANQTMATLCDDLIATAKAA